MEPWAECHLEREKRHSSAGKGGGEPLFNKELTLSLKKLNNLQSLYSDSGLLISLSVCSGSITSLGLLPAIEPTLCLFSAFSK